MIHQIDYDEVFLEIRERFMEERTPSSIVTMAEFICSCYGGEELGYLFDLKKLSSLDSKNFENCMLIAQYRKSAEWSDTKFYALAMFVKIYI
ncbi:MAG: hypothetical protein NT086_16310 [Proteobacteria bacterium]|nr:hypothetical protein [Pseudomonadota bacterium]